MARYIDADKVLNNLPDDLPYKASVKRVLIQAPEEDVVEVVRCKDCKHKVNFCGRNMCGRLMYRVGENVGGLTATTSEHFCSYGKRKE